MQAFERFHYEKALTCLQRSKSLAKTKDDYIFVVCQLAICLESVGNYRGAVIALEEIPSVNYQTHPELQYFLATAYAFLGQMQESYQLAKAYLQSDDSDFEAEATELLQELKQIKG
ncbi:MULTISPECIES: hypothetical protein [Latilactobacillus]|nr:hypothetical protein [Latilactobacillus sakei]KRK70064.1 hypothetical protein FD49_GL001812 [Latilactobacillus sakei subsp. sakei DSM 20017 = JCM 1157]MCP8852303.1 hypothetical protein [Latilactobacillus sakei]MDB1552424.1 hypothetical protein [Latilactobacillus sakei]MDG9751846.1 hypothetical protein [Latilactobacillus sakei]MDH0601101.1 hypothetical protein [Latilactobacillus sakei]